MKNIFDDFEKGKVVSLFILESKLLITFHLLDAITLFKVHVEITNFVFIIIR